MTPELSYHTIIIGAGPAGLASAHRLAKAGKKTLVIERKSNPGNKVCAGGVTWSGIQGDIPEELLEKSFSTQHVKTPWQKAIIKSPVPLVSTLSRDKLSRWMLNRAKNAGAKIITARLKTLSNNLVHTDSGDFHFENLIGADGSNSTVRRLMGIATEQVGIGINYFVRGNFPNMEWHLSERFFGTGYAWIFPHDKVASIGAYASRDSISGERLKKNLHHWCSKHGITLGGSKMTAATINYDHRGWDFGNIFLAGDAAGLASPLTGEGIYPGIVSGNEIAKTILDRNHERTIMDHLIDRHRTHLKMVALAGKNRTLCRLSTELAVCALRLGIIPFNKIEMTG